MARQKDFVVVCAIDFGTTFSGYASSFSSTPQDIIMNKNWGENLGFQVNIFFLKDMASIC